MNTNPNETPTMTSELKELIEQAEALLARILEALDRAEALAKTQPEAGADPLAGHPELPLGVEEDAAEIRWEATAEAPTTSTRRDAVEASAPKLINTIAAARFLGIGKRTVQELTAARKLAFIKVGRTTRFHVVDLEAFIDANRVKAAGRKESKAITTADQ